MLTLEEYKDLRGISSTVKDAVTTILLESASKLVRNYCDREFTTYYDTNYVETFSLKWYQNVVFLKEIPIVEVVSVEILESDDTYTALTTSQYKVDTNLDAIYRVESGTRLNYPIGINSVRVTYKAGYSSTPKDLQLAIADLVDYYMDKEWKPEKNHTSFTISNSPDSPAFPPHIKRVLDLYKNVV